MARNTTGDDFLISDESVSPPAMKRRQNNAVSRPRRWCLTAVVAIVSLLALDAGVKAETPTALPKLVISPPGDGLRALFEHSADWSQARTQTGAILYADHNLTHLGDAELQNWFAMMRAWHISLELEVGAIKEWAATADATFAAEQPIWDRALRLGADLRSIAMDEPLAASRSLHKPDDYAVEQTVRFIGLVHQHYPTVHVGDIEPYPSLPLADHVAWLKQLTSRLKQQNLAPFDFYRADVDWVSFAKASRGSWREVASLAAATSASGLPFSLIYWASGYPSEKAEGLAGDDTWYIEVLGQGYAAADAGVHPDQFVLESWLDTPPRVVPDSAEFSFTKSVLDFGTRFVNAKAAVVKRSGQ